MVLSSRNAYFIVLRSAGIKSGNKIFHQILFKRFLCRTNLFPCGTNWTKLFAKNFSKDSNFDDSGISSPVFPTRTNLKFHNISIIPKMVKKVITNLDSSKKSGPDWIPVVVLKNCEPELSYILTELSNMCLKESCFPDLLLLKPTTLLVSFLWLVKSLKNL